MREPSLLGLQRRQERRFRSNRELAPGRIHDEAEAFEHHLTEKRLASRWADQARCSSLDRAPSRPAALRSPSRPSDRSQASPLSSTMDARTSPTFDASDDNTRLKTGNPGCDRRFCTRVGPRASQKRRRHATDAGVFLVCSAGGVTIVVGTFFATADRQSRMSDRPSAPTVVSPPASGSPPRLLDRVRDAIRTRHYSRRTEEAYVYWIRRYIVFHKKTHPATMGAPEDRGVCRIARQGSRRRSPADRRAAREGPQGSGDDAALGGERGVGEAPGGRPADA